MVLMEQSGAGDGLRLGTVPVDQIGDVSEQVLHRHPDAGFETGIQTGVLRLQPSLAAPLGRFALVSTDGHGRSHLGVRGNGRCWSRSANALVYAAPRLA